MKFTYKLQTTYTYEEYFNLTTSLAEAGKTTGDNQSEALVEFTQLNHRRMKRLNKTVKLSDSTIKALSRVAEKQRWIVISEAWCGDAAQNLPAINKMTESSENISLEIVLRDENLELMDAFLTNGGRSIPKLIAVNQDNEVLFTWGPRPKTAQEMLLHHKENSETESAEEFKLKLHTWYTTNKSVELQEEISALL